MAKTAENSGSQMIKVYDARLDKIVLVARIDKTDEQWKKILTPEQYDVTAKSGTERPFTCTFEQVKENGIYKCVRCGTDLFRAGTKFESGTGWPSFFEPISDLNIRTETDRTLGMARTEVLCARCGSHLGHVFDDGPPRPGKDIVSTAWRSSSSLFPQRASSRKRLLERVVSGTFRTSSTRLKG